ncbi:MAG: hypothetical protein R3C55_03440 [Parvularculaceae bacterium]
MRRSPFFVLAGVFVIAIAMIGFSKTFFLPVSRGSFSPPPAIWIHAALMFCWIFLFLTQTILISTRNVRLHMRLGLGGAILAATIVPFGFAAGLSILGRDIGLMGVDAAYSAFLPTIIEPLLFGALVASAIALRRRPDFHKRLMLLATLSILGPAWFRFRHFFPSVENPLVVFGFWLAITPMVGAALWDALKERRIHPVYLTALPMLLAVYVVEVWGGGHPAFIAASKAVAGLLGAPSP